MYSKFYVAFYYSNSSIYARRMLSIKMYVIHMRMRKMMNSDFIEIYGVEIQIFIMYCSHHNNKNCFIKSVEWH